MSAEENKVVVRRYLDEAWTKRNVDIIDELMASDYARYLPGQDKPLDRETQKQRIAGFHKAMPDMVFMGVAPGGKQLTVTAIDIARLENGKIVDHWGQMDMLGLMRQLGLVPTPG